MQSITTSKVNINDLHDYLITDLEGFHRVLSDSGGLDTATDECGRLHELGDVVTVFFADDLDIKDVQAKIDKFNS